MTMQRSYFRVLLLGTAFLAIAACERQLDWDVRSGSGGLNTAAAARVATTQRPQPDSRGIISYPNYQVAVAKRGDTVESLANRIGMPAADLARYNAVKTTDALRENEVLALPRRVTEPSPATGSVFSGPITPGGVDIGSIATTAIDRVDASAGNAGATNAGAAQRQTGAEPIRHKIVRGETAYSIARLYNVSTKALADWNGLGPDLSVREGQYLLIPLANAVQPMAGSGTSAPGQGSATPEPPSASKPLPAEKTLAASAAAAAAPASPNLGTQRSAASAAHFAMPADGKIIRTYVPKKNDGIDIGAIAGSPVRAAGDGTVAAITTDTEQVPIMVIRHPDNLLTVYANIDGITVAKGATVKRGQTIAKVRAASPAFLHFEVRKGFDSVDPMPYLQ